MKSEKILPILKGILSSVLPLKRFKIPQATGGTCDSSYCYSVWMLHLQALQRNGMTNIPKIVAELGPGDSIGTGLAALLAGAEHYYALDIHTHWNTEKNLTIFDELVELFRNEPGIATDLLSEERISSIRKEIASPTAEARFIHCFVPWQDTAIIQNASVDLIISQSVLEYMDDLEGVYHTLSEWLKPGAMMSHAIDLSSLGLTTEWNGHWTYSDLQWRLYKGKRIMTINRAPASVHLSLIEKNAMEILQLTRTIKDNHLATTDLALAYKGLSEDDLNTSAIFIQCRKRSSP